MTDRIKNNAMPHRLELDHVDYLSVFRDFDEGVIITDMAGVIVYYNEAMASIDDLVPEDVVGKKVTEIYDLTDDTSNVMECIKNGRPIVNRHFFYRTRMGKVANTIHRVFPLLCDGRQDGTICLVKDYNVLEETIASVAIPKKKSELNNGTIYTFADIIGENPAFMRAVNTAVMSANSPSPVMLYGETGTGKELLAQSIHNHSSRNKQQYIPVNCAAIPENLLEGILFGTSKGAFTGAMNKPGLFERASGGTLFLDEVNAMSISLQAKILRVLQEKRVRRVGALKEIDIDLKIISSVNQEPHRAIEAGTLRPDLFYRLGVVFIAIPPLREKRDDIEKLIRHFLDKHSRALGKGIPSVSEAVMALFNRYPWPGNVRELEHVIESAMNLVQPNDAIQFNHLRGHLIARFENWPHEIGSPALPPAGAFSAPAELFETITSKQPSAKAPGKSLMQIRTEGEKSAIINALVNASGNVSRAAGSIGISRQLLHYKMKKYHLNRTDFR
ncbi:MAG: sigma 54-interacting transcriptional regulator [Desulfobacterales bacterium]|jgi:arginine utilization regulatory protein